MPVYRYGKHNTMHHVMADLSILLVTGQLGLNCNVWFFCSSIGGNDTYVGLEITGNFSPSIDNRPTSIGREVTWNRDILYANVFHQFIPYCTKQKLIMPLLLLRPLVHMYMYLLINICGVTLTCIFERVRCVLLEELDIDVSDSLMGVPDLFPMVNSLQDASSCSLRSLYIDVISCRFRPSKLSICSFRLDSVVFNPRICNVHVQCRWKNWHNNRF